MRIVFFSLVFTNFVLLLWLTQISSSNAGKDFPEVPIEGRLVLMDEHLEAQEAAINPISGATPDELPDIEVSGAESVAGCYTIGPFKDLEQVENAAKEITEQGIDIKQRSKNEREQFGYRVYLRPYETRGEALEVARRLGELDFDDYFVITDGIKDNGISLGLFRKKSGAIRRMSRVRNADFSPSLEITYREITVYWLDYEDPEKRVTEDLWQDMLEDAPNLQRLGNGCILASN